MSTLKTDRNCQQIAKICQNSQKHHTTSSTQQAPHHGYLSFWRHLPFQWGYFHPHHLGPPLQVHLKVDVQTSAVRANLPIDCIIPFHWDSDFTCCDFNSFLAETMNVDIFRIFHHEHSQVAPTLVQSSCKGQQCRQPDAFSLDKSDIYVSPSTKNTTILSRIPRKGRSVSYDVGGWQIPLTLWKRKSDQKDQMSKSCFFRNILEKGNDSFFHVFRIFMMMSNDFTLQGLHFPPCCCKQWKSTSNPNKEPPSLGLLSTFPKTRDFTCDLMWWTSSSLNDQF